MRSLRRLRLLAMTSDVALSAAKGLVVLALAAAAARAHHSIVAVQAQDPTGAIRTSFSNSERIRLFASVSISRDDTKNIQFTFVVKDPAGKVVLRQSGNSIPGQAGSGGSSFDIAISKFFTHPGTYTLEVTATAPSGSVSPGSVSGSATFSVTSPQITLLYPPNGATDLLDRPLIFRWAGTGAAKYRLSVDDDSGFFATLFTGETSLTEFTYPTDPPDIRQRLQAGILYHWKVEGLNLDGTVAAVTAFPFTFTIAAPAAPPTSRDLAIEKIAQDPAAMNAVKVDVFVRNQGGKSETQVPVNLFANGAFVGNQTLASIGAGGTAVASFYPKPFPSGNTLFTAGLDFFDDYNKNNILSASLFIVAPEVPKILGKVEEEGDPSGLYGIILSYEGPTGKSGRVASGPGGQYKIDDLIAGEYTVTVEHPDYLPARRKVTLDSRAMPNVDFVLQPKPLSQADAAALLLRQVPPDVARRLEGYDLVDIEVPPGTDLTVLVRSVYRKKARIASFDLEVSP